MSEPEGRGAPPVPAGDQPDAERVVSAIADADDRVIESALRPKRLSELVGQVRVREQLALILEGALRRGRPPDHVLISGPPGRPRRCCTWRWRTSGSTW